MPQPPISFTTEVPNNDSVSIKKRVTKPRYISMLTLVTDASDAITANAYIEDEDGNTHSLATHADDGDSPTLTSEAYPVALRANTPVRLLQPQAMAPYSTLVVELKNSSGAPEIVQGTASSVSAVTLDNLGGT